MRLSYFYALRKIIFCRDLVHGRRLPKWMTWSRDVFGTIPVEISRKKLVNFIYYVLYFYFVQRGIHPCSFTIISESVLFQYYTAFFGIFKIHNKIPFLFYMNNFF